MTPTAIPLERLALILLPVVAVLVFVQRWCGEARGAWIAFGRMVVQLLAVGYVLTAIFEAEHPAVVGLVAAVMLTVGAWTALRPLGRRTGASLRRALFAIAAGAFSSSKAGRIELPTMSTEE